LTPLSKERVSKVVPIDDEVDAVVVELKRFYWVLVWVSLLALCVYLPGRRFVGLEPPRPVD
jgi:hypothetical protein